MEPESEKERRLRETGLAFFGRIAASVSHDINNVLSTIGEYTGLLNDFITAGRKGGTIAPERLQRLADGLASQVEKGAAIVKRLNRFAHSADDTKKPVDLTEQIAAITTLARRFANLKQVALQTDLPSGPINLLTNPFVLQQAVFSCIDSALLCADRNHPVVVSVEPHEDQAVIVIFFTPADSATEVDSQLPTLTILTAELGGTVQSLPGEDGTHRFVLALPRE